jgi:hypothetical protein
MVPVSRAVHQDPKKLTPTCLVSNVRPSAWSLSNTHTKPSSASSSLTTAKPRPEQPPVTLQISRRSHQWFVRFKNEIWARTHKNIRPPICILRVCSQRQCTLSTFVMRDSHAASSDGAKHGREHTMFPCMYIGGDRGIRESTPGRAHIVELEVPICASLSHHSLATGPPSL